MKYTTIKTIGEKISAIGLGTWQFSGGDSWSSFDQTSAIKTVHKAIDEGINFIDTAPVYGLGHSETIVGKALRGKRDKVFLASKCGLPWDGNMNVSNNLSKESLMKEIDESLKRLQTNHIDLYQMHWPDHGTDIEETMEALMAIQKSGKIRHIGASNFSLDLLKRAMSVGQVSTYQGLYNMMERNATHYHGIELGYELENEINPYLKEKGMGLLPYSPLMQGFLTGKLDMSKLAKGDVRHSNLELTGENLLRHEACLKNLKHFSFEIGRPMSQIALNYILEKVEVLSIIAGSMNGDHVKDNIEATTWQLEDQMIERLDMILGE